MSLMNPMFRLVCVALLLSVVSVTGSCRSDDTVAPAPVGGVFEQELVVPPTISLVPSISRLDGSTVAIVERTTSADGEHYVFSFGRGSLPDETKQGDCISAQVRMKGDHGDWCLPGNCLLVTPHTGGKDMRIRERAHVMDTDVIRIKPWGYDAHDLSGTRIGGYDWGAVAQFTYRLQACAP